MNLVIWIVMKIKITEKTNQKRDETVSTLGYNIKTETLS
jgi:hypothetical protein